MATVVNWKVFDPSRVHFDTIKTKEFINAWYATGLTASGKMPLVIEMPVARVAFPPKEYKAGDADKGSLGCSISFVGADPWMRDPSHPADDLEFAELRAFLPKLVALQARFRAHVTEHQATLAPKFDEEGHPVTRAPSEIEIRPLIKLSKSGEPKVPDGKNPPTMSAKMHFGGDRATGLFDGLKNNARVPFNKNTLAIVLPMGARVRTHMELTGATYKDNVPGLAFAFKVMQIVPAKANAVCPFAPVSEDAAPVPPQSGSWGGGSSMAI